MQNNLANLQLLIGVAAINEACAQISTQGKALDDYIQYTGLSVLNHVELHGDVTVVNRLYQNMPKGSRRAALTEWLLAHGKIIANPDPKSSKEHPFLYDKSKQTVLAAAAEKPWFEFKPDRDPIACFDLQQALRSLLSRAKKAGAVSDPEALAQIELLAEKTKPALPTAVPVGAEVMVGGVPPALH